MYINLIDTDKTISVSVLVISGSESYLDSEWLPSLFTFPQEQFDSDGSLLLTQAEYNDYKLSAQSYANAISTDGNGIMLIEEEIY